MPLLVGALTDWVASASTEARLLAFAWARAMPSVTLVPAFGLRALPVPARAVLGLAFAAVVFPALAPLAAAVQGRPFLVTFLIEVVHGVPVALAAAVPLWAATMAGGVADSLRGSQEAQSAPTGEGRATPLGIPMSLLACTIFVRGGGPSRVALALAQPLDGGSPALAAAGDLVRGISLAVALAGPLLVASVVLEVAAALVARAASPAQVHALLSPVRALGILTVMAVVLERLTKALGSAVSAVP